MRKRLYGGPYLSILESHKFLIGELNASLVTIRVRERDYPLTETIYHLMGHGVTLQVIVYGEQDENLSVIAFGNEDKIKNALNIPVC